MANWIVKHNNKILRYNSDNNIVGYNYDAIADFAASGYTTATSQISINQNDSVNFVDHSTNANSWSWNFGTTASPSTSNVQNPTGITYNTSGVTETVSLSVSNQISSDTKTKTDYVSVGGAEKPKLLIDFYAKLQKDLYQEYTWSGGTYTRTFNSFYTNAVNTGMTLQYDDGTLSDYTCELETAFDTTYSNGAITGDDTGVYPDDVMVQNFVDFDDATSPEIRISGLTTSNTYKFTFFGSRDSWVATSRYTITGGTDKDGSYVTLDTDSNVYTTVSISSITPSDEGTIGVIVTAESNLGLISVLEIEEGG